jgi:hypothetical protein
MRKSLIDNGKVDAFRKFRKVRKIYRRIHFFFLLRHKKDRRLPQSQSIYYLSIYIIFYGIYGIYGQAIGRQGGFAVRKHSVSIP